VRLNALGRLSAAAGVLAIVLAGCASQPMPAAVSQPGPQTKAVASAPTSQPAGGEVETKAQLGLAELSPRIAQPVNPPDAIELPEQAKPLLDAAGKLMVRRDFAAAVARLERAAGFAPDNPRIRRMLGLAYAKLPNPGKAEANLTRAVKVAPDDLSSQLALGRLAAGQRQNARAILHLRTALVCTGADSANPQAAEALSRLATLLGEEGYWRASLEAWRKLGDWIDLSGRDYTGNALLKPLVLSPEKLLREQGLLLNRLGQFDAAVAVLDRAYRRNRADARTARLLIETLTKAGRYARAEELLVAMVDEPSQRSTLAETARILCEASADRQMPQRIWRAIDARKRPAHGALAEALAEAAMSLGDEAQAIAILDSVVEAMPGNVAAGRALARLYARQGQGEKALRLLAEILVADPSATTVVEEGVREIINVQLPDGFERTFAASIRSQQDPQDAGLHYVAGQLAQQRRKHYLAAEEYGRAIEADDRFLPAYQAILGIYLSQRRYDQAERLLERIARLPEDQYGYFQHYARGKVHLRRGQLAQALEELQQARTMKDDHVETLLLLGDAYVRSRRIPSATRALLTAWNIAPDRPEVSRRLFDFFLAARQGDRARQVAEKLLAGDGRSIAGRVMLAEIELLSGRRDEAARLAERLQVEAPRNRDVILLAARLTLAEQTLSDADFAGLVRRLGGIIRAESENEKARLLLSATLARRDDLDQAAAVWGRLYEDTARNPDVARHYVGSLIAARQYEQAVVVLSALLTDDPQNLWARQLLMAMLEKLQRYDELATHLAAWIAQAEDEQAGNSYRMILIQVHQVAKRYAAALTLVEELLDRGVTEIDGADLRAARIQILGSLERYDKAAELADKWIAAEPDAMLPRKVLLGVFVQSGQHDRALALVDEYLPDFPVNSRRAERAELLSLKSTCLAEAGKHAEALSALEQAHGIAGDDPGICNNLGYMYAEAGTNLDKAERLVRKALAARGDSMEARDSLGWVFYKQGRFAEASRVFDQLLSMKAGQQPTDGDVHPVVLDHAGDVCYRLAQRDKALDFWTRAVAAANKAEPAMSDARKILLRTPAKIEALQAGLEVKVAPLGKAIAQPTTAATTAPDGAMDAGEQTSQPEDEQDRQ